MVKTPLELLLELGFNELEAEVYLHLLPNPPATAYAVGKAIGRPTANVYKAVDALARRGAALIEEGDNRLCRAVPVAEFLAHARASFHQLATDAGQQLGSLQSAPPDERVYRIESIDQLFERARMMLESTAQKIAIVDAFPEALEMLRGSIQQATARGVEVFVEAYTPTKVKGAKVAHAAIAAAAPQHWGAIQMNLVVDGREHLLALLSRDGKQIHQAVWSRSLYLSCLHHSGRLCEYTLMRMIDAADRSATRETFRRILDEHRFFVRDTVPGQTELFSRFASGSEK